MRPFHPPQRHAITLVEVIFAIGVILIGLVGLASVLPVAGRRAQDAIDLNEASALASAVFDELKAKGALERSAWVVRLDAPVGAFAAGQTPPVLAAFPNATSWCLDPLFVSADVSANPPPNGFFQPLASNGTGFRRMLFPYIRADHSPYRDPSLPFAGGWPAVAPFGPRMLRVGIGRQQGGVLNAREAEALVETLDEMTTFEPQDRTLNAVAQSNAALQGGSPLGKRRTNGSLTWIATVNRLAGTPHANVSVVVMRKRDRSFFTALDPSNPVTNPAANANDERLAYVTYANGFRGGNGGTVQLSGPAETPPSGGTSPRIVTNDWVMLSRRLPAGGDVHRWYRVASVDEEPQFLTINEPRDVWQRTVYLDGPDWSFGFPTPGVATGNEQFHTYATIMNDVVSVSEHTIRLPLP